MNNRPKISIITVCYNEDKDIENTCRSVVSQGYKNYEWIVVDGGSTDRTLEILDKYKSNISVLISEKDQGVYDAMNKGIRLARGEYLLFLNGGDYLFSDDIFQKVFCEKSPQGDVLYGNCCILERDGSSKILDFSKKINKYYFLDTCINHQSTFIKKHLFEKFGLYDDQNYKISADYEKWLNFIHNKADFKKLPFVVSNFKVFDGLSSSEQTRELNESERKRAIQKYFVWYEIFFCKMLKYVKNGLLTIRSVIYYFLKNLFNFSPKKFIMKHFNKLLNSRFRKPARRIWFFIIGKKI